MLREFSAGGIVLRRRKEAWWLAAVELPEKPSEEAAAKSGSAKKTKVVLTLPKGLIDSGEKPAETALREVREETGVTADLLFKLGDVKYIYVRSWSDQERVFKIVSFYLMRYRSGRIDDINPEMRIEVAQAKWIPLEDAPKLLAYQGEKQMARLALEHVAKNPEL